LKRWRGKQIDVCSGRNSSFEERDVFQAMVGKQSGAMVQQVLHKILLDLVRDDVKATLPRDDGGAIPAEALAQFIAGGLFGLLMWWLNSRMRPTVEEVNGIFRRLTVPTVKAAAVRSKLALR
jgi:hypothetical protein